MPASIAAPLPSVSAALEEMQQAGEEQAAAVAAQQALVLAPVQVSCELLQRQCQLGSSRELPLQAGPEHFCNAQCMCARVGSCGCVYVG